MAVADHTAGTFLTAFNQEAERLVGKSADELGVDFECDKDSFKQKVNEAALFKTYNFVIRTKMDTYNVRLSTLRNVVIVAQIDE